MSGGEIRRCVAPHAEDELAAATGYVRYVRNTDDTEVINGPYCDPCQALRCRHFRHQEAMQEIREVGAIPLDYRERIAEATRTGIVRRIREELGRHPGGPREVADDLVEVILQTSGTVLPTLVLARLQRWAEDLDAGRISDQRALADRRATGCQYDSGLCACPSAPYEYEGCRAK